MLSKICIISQNAVRSSRRKNVLRLVARIKLLLLGPLKNCEGKKQGNHKIKDCGLLEMSNFGLKRMFLTSKLEMNNSVFQHCYMTQKHKFSCSPWKKPTASAKNRTRSHFFGCQSLTFLLGVMINPFSEVHLSIGELAIFPSHRSQRNDISKSRRQRVKVDGK